MFEVKDWKPNKLQALFLRRQSKESLAFSKVVTSFWVKLVSSWMGHKVGTTSLVIAIFQVVPPT
jgi:hypothetical protein